MSRAHSDPSKLEIKNSQLARIAEGVLADLYVELLVELDKIKQRLKSGEDKQQICIEAIWHVKNFLDANPEVRDAGLTEPFGQILASFSDIRKGGPAPLFKIHKNPAGGQSPGKSATVAVPSVAAACFTLLRKVEVEPAEAADFVVRELAKFGYDRSSKGIITAKTIVGWRDEMGGRIVGKGLKIYLTIINEVEAGLGEKFISHNMRGEVSNIIRALRDAGIPKIHKSD